jgi:hypothetical protein
MEAITPVTATTRLPTSRQATATDTALIYRLNTIPSTAEAENTKDDHIFVHMISLNKMRLRVRMISKIVWKFVILLLSISRLVDKEKPFHFMSAENFANEVDKTND